MEDVKDLIGRLMNHVDGSSFSDEELKGLSWTSFVASLTQPELIQYLKERRLYVSEPVEMEEDV